MKAHAPLPPAPYKRPLEASRGLHDWLLEPSGGGLWGSRGPLGGSWVTLGSSWAVMEPSWAAVGVVLRPSCGFLGPS